MIKMSCLLVTDKDKDFNFCFHSNKFFNYQLKNGSVESDACDGTATLKQQHCHRFNCRRLNNCTLNDGSWTEAIAKAITTAVVQTTIVPSFKWQQLKRWYYRHLNDGNSSLAISVSFKPVWQRSMHGILCSLS